MIADSLPRSPMAGSDSISHHPDLQLVDIASQLLPNQRKRDRTPSKGSQCSRRQISDYPSASASPAATPV